MKNYERPIMIQNDEMAEGIYLASGDGDSGNSSTGGTGGSTVKTCRFGFDVVKVDDAKCKRCINSGGTTTDHVSGEIPPGQVYVTADQEVFHLKHDL